MKTFGEMLMTAGQDAPPLDAIPPEPSYLERLRDDYAGRAMAALIPTHAVPDRYSKLATRAWEMADAMLAERGKR
jgi:hypothetical protein